MEIHFARTALPCGKVCSSTRVPFALIVGLCCTGSTLAAAPLQAPTILELSGPEGGPFTSTSFDVPIFNGNAYTVHWRARSAHSWPSLSQTGGVLAPDESGLVVLSINDPAASLLPVGAYVAELLHRNLPGEPIGVLARMTLTVEAAGEVALPMATASRTSGVAPLAVFFDALAPQSGVPAPGGAVPDYATTLYSWSFADPSSGTWSHNGRPKNESHGYMAAHVFEVPGSYAVKLRVHAPAGGVFDYEQEITVLAPEAVYAGQTYYVSNTAGNDSSDGLAPESAFRTVSKAMTTLFATNGPRRVLFRAGESWDVSSPINVSGRSGPYTIGSYGSGTNPLLRIVHAGSGFYFAPSVRDVRIMDVELAGPGTAQSGTGVLLGKDSLLLRSLVRGFRTGVASHDSLCIGNTIAECALLDNQDYGMYIAPAYSPTSTPDPPIHLAVLGNRLDNSLNNSLLRTYVSRSVLQANLFERAGQSATRVLGIHAPKKAEFVLILDNRFACDTAWVLEIGPENDSNGGGGGVPQIVENVLLEGNHFSVPPGADITRFVLVFGRHVTLRNNVFDHTGASWGATLRVAPRGIGPVPVGVRVDNNTVYRGTASGGTWTFVDAQSQDLTLVRNNIVYSPLATVTVAAGTASSLVNWTANPFFLDAIGGDFRLQSHSPAIGQALPLDIHIDFNGDPRPAGPSGIDIGALEVQ